MGVYFIHNNKFYKDGQPTVNIQSRGLRYGDGFFETMKVNNGIIQHKELHFLRILKTMKVLHFEFSKKMNIDEIELAINKLLIKNKHLKEARVRLTFIRKDGGLYDEVKNTPDVIIETSEIKIEPKLNSNGLTIGIYEEARKCSDELSNLKTNNFLPYIMAAFDAKKNKLNDCILLNNQGRIADTTIANIFLVKDKIISTPALTEGCIAGVKREFLIPLLKEKYKVTEAEISLNDLMEADEVFLTNTIRGIRWVKDINDKIYTNKTILEIYNFVSKTI